LRPATRRSHGGPLPHHQADRTRPHPIPVKPFPTPPCRGAEHPALPPVSRSYSGVRGRLVTHYSPVRHSHPPASWQDPVRLACVKHAASVRPEPESNPPQKNLHEEPKNMTRKKEKKKTDKTPTRKPRPMLAQSFQKTRPQSQPLSGHSTNGSHGRTGNQNLVVQNTLLSSQTTTTQASDSDHNLNHPCRAAKDKHTQEPTGPQPGHSKTEQNR
ncbi:peptide YY, partial [Bifidobacterium vansinderenii]